MSWSYVMDGDRLGNCRRYSFVGRGSAVVDSDALLRASRFHAQKQTTSDGTRTRITHSAAVCLETGKAFLTNKTWEELLCRGEARFQAPGANFGASAI